MISSFTANLAKGSIHFRYFAKRPVQVIHRHLATSIITDEQNTPVAYGHLEKEDDILWLGIAVADEHIGKGLGKMMLNHLIDTAHSKHEKQIRLSVDHDNHIAQKLYTHAGFVKIKSLPAGLIFELTLHY
jgi:GNAT superfamily N-acetyltransferase